MSAREKAKSAAEELNAVPLQDVGHVLVVGIQGLIHAALDVADAIREQTTKIEAAVTDS